jgi:hypothetical protein
MTNIGRWLLLVVVAGCGPAGNSPPATHTGHATAGRARHARTLDPRFPVIEGKCEVADHWSVTLPGKFNRRTQSGDLILWRRGLTLYVVAWDGGQHESRAKRLASIKEKISAHAFDFREMDDGEILRFAYRLTEYRDGKVVHAFYGYAISDVGHVQTATYCDHDSDLAVARQIWRSWSQISAP